MGHTEFMEERNVVFWSEDSISILVRVGVRSHECYKFIWNNPIKITILHFLVVFIEFGVEVLEVIPA